MERRRAIWNAADLQARLYRKEKCGIFSTPASQLHNFVRY
jgi:hypothetical protein